LHGSLGKSFEIKLHIVDIKAGNIGGNQPGNIHDDKQQQVTVYINAEIYFDDKHQPKVNEIQRTDIQEGKEDPEKIGMAAIHKMGLKRSKMELQSVEADSLVGERVLLDGDLPEYILPTLDPDEFPCQQEDE